VEHIATLGEHRAVAIKRKGKLTIDAY
jgi:hypothetical protein